MVGDLRMWLYRTHSGNPRQMRRRRPLSANSRTPQPTGYGSILSRTIQGTRLTRSVSRGLTDAGGEAAGPTARALRNKRLPIHSWSARTRPRESAAFARVIWRMLADVMTRGVFTVERGLPLREAAAQMVARSVGAAIVLDGERLLGILTERDVLRAVGADRDKSATVEDCMT